MYDFVNQFWYILYICTMFSHSSNYCKIQKVRIWSQLSYVVFIASGVCTLLTVNVKLLLACCEEQYQLVVYMESTTDCIRHSEQHTPTIIIKTRFHFSPAPFQGRPLGATGTKSEDFSENETD